MARMIPETGPVKNDSRQTEPDLYWRLAKQLPAEFTVIHSLPWLSAVAREIDGRDVPTGELDFIVFHPQLGILAIEVKGGRLKYDKTKFILINTNEAIDPIRQVRRGTHALSKHLASLTGKSYKIGYALAFPNSDMQGRIIPPALIDYSGENPESICIDHNQLNTLEQRIVDIMRFWKKRLNTTVLSRERITELIDCICPEQDYSPFWSSRIEYDNKAWLRLTEEQSDCLKTLEKVSRFVLTGRSGTGKTVIAQERARQLAKSGKSILFVVYNFKLLERYKAEIQNPRVEVRTFHSLCREAAKLLDISIPVAVNDLRQWYQEGGPTALKKAIEAGKMPAYDSLIIDEAQVLHADWLTSLKKWFSEKSILVCCDETQSFEFEHKTSAVEISEILKCDNPFTLTINVRSPKTVFRRLMEAQPTPYQQASLRADDFDTLTEVAVLNPLDELIKTLLRLHEENVPRGAIAVVCTNDKPPETSNLDKLAGEIEVITRYRGLEAPVVIVWVTGKTHDATLACSYARATSRCIVIYDVFTIARRSYQCDFIRIMEKSETAPKDLFKKVNEFWPITKQLQLTVFALQTVNLLWSDRWGAWVLEGYTQSDHIHANMWRNYLIEATNFSVYYFREEDLNLEIFTPKQFNSEPHALQRRRIWWCNQCKQWTLFETNISTLESVCTECDLPKNTKSLPAEVIEQLHRHEETFLLSKSQANWQRKKALPFPLFVLGCWEALTKSQQADLLKMELISSYPQDLAIVSSRILTYFCVVQHPVNTNITLQRLREYWLIQYPKLHEYFDKAMWERKVTAAVNALIGKKLLCKVRRGEYLRLDWQNSQN